MEQRRRKPVAEMSAAELVSYAKSNYGIDLSPKWSKERLIDAIRDYESVPDAVGVDASGAPVTDLASITTDASEDMEEKVPLLIHKTSNDNEPTHVFASVNGRSILIERGVEVMVARKFVRVLQNAVQRRYRVVQDAASPGGQRIEMRETPSYPFSSRG